MWMIKHHGEEASAPTFSARLQHLYWREVPLKAFLYICTSDLPKDTALMPFRIARRTTLFSNDCHAHNTRFWYHKLPFTLKRAGPLFSARDLRGSVWPTVLSLTIFQSFYQLFSFKYGERLSHSLWWRQTTTFDMWYHLWVHRLADAKDLLVLYGAFTPLTSLQLQPEIHTWTPHADLNINIVYFFFSTGCVWSL